MVAFIMYVVLLLDSALLINMPQISYLALLAPSNYRFGIRFFCDILCRSQVISRKKPWHLVQIPPEIRLDILLTPGIFPLNGV